jgi:integrase
VSIRKHIIFVDDDLIEKKIPEMRVIRKRLVYTGPDRNPILGRNGVPLLSWNLEYRFPHDKLVPMRPFTEDEIIRISTAMSGKYAIRDRAWFLLGIYCGLRPTQLSMLTVGNVSEFYLIKPTFTIPMPHRPKYAQEVMQKSMHHVAEEALKKWLTVLQRVFHGKLNENYPLFLSRKSNKDGSYRNPSRQQYWHIIREACKTGNIEIVTNEGRLCAMSMYKTYLHWASKANGYDVIAIAKLVGHTSVHSTVMALRHELLTPEERLEEDHRQVNKH